MVHPCFNMAFAPAGEGYLRGRSLECRPSLYGRVVKSCPPPDRCFVNDPFSLSFLRFFPVSCLRTSFDRNRVASWLGVSSFVVRVDFVDVGGVSSWRSHVPPSVDACEVDSTTSWTHLGFHAEAGN